VKHNLVLRVIAKILIPFILLFALYVQFHGDFGPGGGFQAGVIFAAAFILYTLVFGLEAARAVVTPGVLRVLSALGVLIFAGVGLRAYSQAVTFSTTACWHAIRSRGNTWASCSLNSVWAPPWRRS